MRTFKEFKESVIKYVMAKPNLGLPKKKAYAKRSSSSAGGGSGDDGGGGDGGDGND